MSPLKALENHVQIILPCTNEGEWLRFTVDSILEHTRHPSFEVRVVANGDTATDFSFLERPAYRGRVRLLRFDEPLGVGKSINVAIEPGSARYYVFLDAHCLLEADDWLERAIACLEEHPDASMVQPEVLEFTYGGEAAPGEPLDPARIERRAFAYAVRWAWPYIHAGYTADYQVEPLSREPYEGMGGGGMAVFTRAETFHRLGCYDPEVGGWYPETLDYCMRAWMLGHPMLIEPRIRVLHRRKTESRGYARRYLDLVHGVLRTTYKYLSPRRRDLAESLFLGHGLRAEVEEARRRIRSGDWLRERARHLRDRTRDDDWLFARFGVYEERWGIGPP